MRRHARWFPEEFRYAAGAAGADIASPAVMTCARKSLVLLNLITFALGVFVLGSAIYVASVFGQGWEVVVSLDTVWLGIAAGTALVVVSGIGLCANGANKRPLMYLYACLQLAITAMLIGACTLVFASYTGYITEAANTTNSTELVTAAAIQLNNGLLSSYTACCSGCHVECTNARPFFNYTTPAPCQNASCAYVAPCGLQDALNISNVAEAGCYVYDDVATTVPLTNGTSTSRKNPPFSIDQPICAALGMVDGPNGAPLVGPVSNGKSCGGGDPVEYRVQVNSYFSSRFYYFAVALACVCAFQILVALLTCAVTMSPERSSPKG